MTSTSLSLWRNLVPDMADVEKAANLARHRDREKDYTPRFGYAMQLANLKIAHLSGLPIMMSHVAGELEQRQRELECSTQFLILR